MARNVAGVGVALEVKEGNRETESVTVDEAVGRGVGEELSSWRWRWKATERRRAQR